MKFNYLIILSLILIGCQGNGSHDSDEKDDLNPANDSLQLAISEANSTKFISLLNSGEEISDDLAEVFIKPALADQYHYVYSTGPSFIYEYGELVYENDSFFVFTFALEGDDGYNMLDAEFIASFNKHTDVFIDSRLIGSASDFESHFSTGYNTRSSVDYEINLVSDKDLIIRVDCSLKDVFYNFDEKITGKPEDTEEIQVSSFEVHVQTNGEMYDSLEE